MTKRILLYGLLVLVLVGTGILVSYGFFEEGESPAPPVSESYGERFENSSGTRPEPRVVVQEPEKASEDASVDDAIKVTSVKGSVRYSMQGEGAWSALSVGESIASDDRVRTGWNSRITLGIGDSSKVEMAPLAEIEIDESTEEKRKLKLIRGKISVDYREEDRKLKIENQDGSTFVETGVGAFGMLNTGTTVAVATKTGKVDLFSAGEKVSVGSGEHALASNGPPSRPAPIPLDVMLRVVDPGCRVQSEKLIIIRGRTSKGTIVSANGNMATLDEKGRFAIRVPLKTGKNRIAIVAEDSAGNKKRYILPCVMVESTAGIEKLDMKWGPPKRQEKL